MDNEPLIEFTPIARQELVVITPPDHPLASRESVVLDETLPLTAPSWQRDFYLATLKDAYHPPVVEAFKRFVLAQTASM